MFDKIIAYSIKQKFVIGLFVIALIGIGLYSLNKLPIDALPDITNNQVQIITTSPNLATQEVELYITYPIELAVKSIPRIVELRSISRFGLSIVTVVFEENADIYWARSQITERLKSAEDEIPKGFGTPELAPISTGLGEIYQYTVSAKAGYEEEMGIMELRSIQDWYIVPQLLGTRGIAEVNTLGGILKEYEVAVNPDRLKGMDITMADIFQALSRNNENTGGAYIDKKPYAYFIRSIGMVSSLDDIAKIVVKTKNDIPILIRDVAEVKFGSTVRYGATTKDGIGEVVNGMVMMLKGQNSAEIVSLVKNKMEQIKETLPEGVEILPYLDRSKLVDRAISTVSTNLIEGALIVIFILVLLIGNWRAGLIVASVIPLALLFAVSMMRLFGVSGNLMSLGAIDFGLIVDGAVIIVEAIVHKLHLPKISRKLTVAEMDQEVYKAASGIRNSAAFGEIIILIVYLPILALVGIEGKMFTPMAQTVGFAILGAFILSLTYIPMMSALCLSKKTGHKEDFSDKIIAAFQRMYSPILEFALKFKSFVLVLTLLLFALSAFAFSRLGGEFIPTLFEGDIATHLIIPPGSSLLQEIESTTKAERLLLDNFPEIEQVVSKIGSSEVPTDPMPMEVADVMIILKDKSEWTSASTKQEMFEKMEEVLDVLPGVTTEFSQPIQMRFNELMTGVRSDVGVKIFGDDIERLVVYGDQLVAILSNVQGIEDARAEAVSGLPQITVKYDKDKLALYGLNVSDLNTAVSMGFAGQKAGVVYEDEKKFDLVVRLAEPFRQDISNINNLYITLPSGSQIPLGQVADVSYQQGPAQISREDGRRRIIVGFNVRGRDVESVVSEVQSKIKNSFDFPSGYFVKYAGQFENLKRAKVRLSVAVPIALALIFVLLYFTFKSVVQTILVFTAIPLSAIGGVFALMIRDMPFSISAGVGFIALFGVAVLNGIVLISYFNQLKSEGMSDIIERIKLGTSVRLRPVIMTASVASLGFLPMALSSSAGAEVQKPLATVVIGGLITATFLTLIILPILYLFSEKWKQKNGSSSRASALMFSLILSNLLFGITANAQNQEQLTFDEVLEKAMEGPRIKLMELKESKKKAAAEAAYTTPKTNIQASIGQINSFSTDQQYSISQSFNPFLLKASKHWANSQVASSELQVLLSKLELKRDLKRQFNNYSFLKSETELTREKLKVYQQLFEFAKLKFEVGESNSLEKHGSALQLQNVQRALLRKEAEIYSAKVQIESLLGEEIALENVKFEAILAEPILDYEIEKNVLVESLNQNTLIAQAASDRISAERKPDFTLGYFIQSLEGKHDQNGEIVNYKKTPRFQGVNFGVSLPLFAKGYKSQQKASLKEIEITQSKMEIAKLQLESQIKSLQNSYEVEKENLKYFKNDALPNAKMIRENGKIAYESGDIDFLAYSQALSLLYDTELAYLKAIKSFNDLLIDLEYLMNSKN